MNAFLRKLGWAMRRPRKEAELREELEFHLAEETEERKPSGSPKKMRVSPPAAISAASR